MKKIVPLFILLFGCTNKEEELFHSIEGRWIEKNTKQFFFEEWHKIDEDTWGGFSYALPKKELQRIKRMRTFRIKKLESKWVYLELDTDSESMDTLEFQKTEEPQTWIFKKANREEMIRMDGKNLTRNSIFKERSVLHQLEGYQPKVLKEELPYSLLKE